jgi:hypothetical protein
MNVIYEDGQGVPNANSYILEADIEMFLPSVNVTDWDKLSADEKNDHLIIATRFIDTSFTWVGRQKTVEQGLSWPRTNVFRDGIQIPDDSIPKQVKQACVMAVAVLLNDGFEAVISSGGVPVKKEKLAVIETEYFSPANSTYGYKSDYTDINNVLRGFYIIDSGNGGNVIAAEVKRV